MASSNIYDRIDIAILISRSCEGDGVSSCTKERGGQHSPVCPIDAALGTLCILPIVTNAHKETGTTERLHNPHNLKGESQTHLFLP